MLYLSLMISLTPPPATASITSRALGCRRPSSRAWNSARTVGRSNCSTVQSSVQYSTVQHLQPGHGGPALAEQLLHLGHGQEHHEGVVDGDESVPRPAHSAP